MNKDVAALRKIHCLGWRPLLLLALVMTAGLVWATSGAWSNSSALGAPGPVYELTDLRAAVSTAPRAWLDRPLRVRGMLIERCSRWSSVGAPTCLRWQEGLVGAGDGAAIASLPVAWEPVSALETVLRGLPFLGMLTPHPRAVYWGIPAVYDIRLRGEGCPQNTHSPCVVAMLLNATRPDTLPIRPVSNRDMFHMKAQP